MEKFFYRKDLNVTKHGEYKAAVDMKQGMAVKRNDATKQIELAATSAEFQGVVDKFIYNVDGNDTMEIAEGDRARVGVGADYEIVTEDIHTGIAASAVGTEVEVANGLFVPLSTGTAVGKIVDKFANGEVVVRIY